MEVILKKQLLIFLAVTAMAIVIPVTIMAQNKDDVQLKRAILKVENLSCGGCFNIINQSLSSIEGYKGFGANLFRRIIGVDFSAPLTPEEIAKTVTDAGYPARVTSVEEILEKQSFAKLQTARAAYSGCGGGGTRGCGGAAPSVQSNRAPSQNRINNQTYGGSCCAVPPTVQ